MPRGVPLSDETRRKLSEAKKGRPLSEEHRKKMSEALKGRVFSEEHRRKLSEANKGKPLSIATRIKMSEAQKGRKCSEATRIKMSKSGRGRKWSEESRCKLSEARKGKSQSAEARAKMSVAKKGKPLSIDHRSKISEALNGRKMPPRTEELRRKQSDCRKGSKSHRWKGGITSLNKAIRQSFEYKLWREAVFKRDNYTCVFCGAKSTRKNPINADHIKPFCDYPELRFAIDNGRTLCLDCHKKTDTYGARSIRKLEK